MHYFYLSIAEMLSPRKYERSRGTFLAPYIILDYDRRMDEDIARCYIMYKTDMKRCVFGIVTVARSS